MTHRYFQFQSVHSIPQPTEAHDEGRSMAVVLRHSIVLFVLLVLLSTSSLVSSALAATKWALVIGNDNYESVPKLKNAKNDARLMGSTLRDAKFDVREVYDVDRRRFWAEIESLKSRIRKGDEVIFFFAGHGVQISADPVLLPVDILAESENQVRREGIPLIQVQDYLKDARVSVLVIDACRDNPFPSTGTRSIGQTRGLSAIEAAEGTAILMSASRNQKALDSVPGVTENNGLFTYELVKAMRETGTGLDVQSLLKQVRENVELSAKKINHAQRPSLTDETSGKYYIFEPITAPAMAATHTSPAVTPPQATSQMTRVQSTEEIEQELWNSIRDSKNPVDFQFYIKRFPNGRFVANAELQVLRLGGSNHAASSTPNVNTPAPSVAAPISNNRPATITNSSIASASGSGTSAANVAVNASSSEPTNTKPASSTGAATAANTSTAPQEIVAGTTRFRGGFTPTGPARELSGKGEVLWANGDRYIGELRMGVRVGDGEMTWANGQHYVGQWSDDLPNGRGQLTFTNGNKYAGDVTAGVPNGQGRMQFGSGDTYEGQWASGIAHGVGTYIWKNGQRYDGPWVNNKPNGQGKLKFANGNLYEGQVVNGAPHGQGVMRFASSDTYEGHFAEGHPDGQGTYRWKNGDSYVGHWRAGVKHGQGTHSWANGDRWIGEFANDQQTPKGELIRKN